MDPDNEKKQRRVTIRAGSWVLGAVDRFDAGDEAIEDSDVAYVGDILQVASSTDDMTCRTERKKAALSSRSHKKPRHL